MCECIKEYRDLLTKKYGAKTVTIHGYNLICPRDGQKAYSATTTDVEVLIARTTKYGGPGTKKEKVSLLHIYCPFCGKPYKEDQGTPDGEEK